MLKSVNEAKGREIGIQVRKPMYMHEMPQHVIRFYGNTGYALECIELNEIAFVHVEKLNDPFDPVLGCVTDFNDSYAALVSHVDQHHSPQLEYFTTSFPEQKWKETVAGWSNSASAIRAKMFVFSTCAVREESHPRDNLYMWGHYGNGHRGVAIEFDTTALAESVITQDDPNSESPWWEMEYVKDIPRLTCEDIIEFVMNAQPNAENLEAYGPKLASKIQQKLRSKAEVWKSEDEWRLVLGNDETRLRILRHDIPNSAVTAVYLGCLAAEQKQLRNAFVYATQRHYPNAIAFRANMRPGEYALDFEEIARVG